MNNWHSIRLLLIGAVSVVMVASFASSFNQAAYSYGDRQSDNSPQDCKSTPGTDGTNGVSGTSGTSTAGTRGSNGRGGEAGTSGAAGTGGIVSGGIGGHGGKGGAAETKCVIISPELSIPSDVPIGVVLSRPNWDNAIDAGEYIADRIG